MQRRAHLTCSGVSWACSALSCAHFVLATSCDQCKLLITYQVLPCLQAVGLEAGDLSAEKLLCRGAAMADAKLMPLEAALSEQRPAPQTASSAV